jgi:HPt (histidine-containing phosphotransfer) domain-containing protein/CheY-like chemotaxis protein
MNELRVLLIETEPEEAENVSAMLSDANHIVLPAADFGEASEAILVQRFDAVLLGSALPTDEVIRFTSQLRLLERKQQNASRTPVLSYSPALLTGPEGESTVDAYLPEQFEAAHLAAAIQRLAQTGAGGSNTGASVDTGLPIFELDELRAQVAFDDELMVEIIDLFLAEGADQVVEMRQAFETRNLAQLSRVAHTLKGSLSSLHAPRARAHAQELEHVAKAENIEACRVLMSALEQDLGTLQPELIALRNAVAPA